MIFEDRRGFGPNYGVATPLAHPVRVYWLIHADRSVASARLQGYLIHEVLAKRPELGIDSHLVYHPRFYQRDIPFGRHERSWLIRAVRGGIVVAQKLAGPRSEQLLHSLAEARVPTVYIQCDHEPLNRAPDLCCKAICPSKELAIDMMDRGICDVTYISDPVETIWPTPVHHGFRHCDLRVAWVGHRDNWESLEIVRSVLEEEEFRDFKLVTISNHPQAEVAWSLEAVRDILPTCDLGIIPVLGGDSTRIKSANRALSLMAAGLPVVAGRMKAYEDLIEPGETGFLAGDADDFRHAFRLLRDPEIRRRIGTNGRELACRDFSIDRVAERWAECLRAASPHPSGRPRAAELAWIEASTSFRLAEELVRLGRTAEAWEYFREGLARSAKAPHPKLAWRAGRCLEVLWGPANRTGRKARGLVSRFQARIRRGATL